MHAITSLLHDEVPIDVLALPYAAIKDPSKTQRLFSCAKVDVEYKGHYRDVYTVKPPNKGHFGNNQVCPL